MSSTNSGLAPTKIKILFVAANPRDTVRLRLGEEIHLIEDRLRKADYRDQFELEQHHALRQNDLAEYLLRYQPHIIHFSGHGSDKGEIVLEDDQGKATAVSADALRELFKLLKDNIRCVVLNACWSEIQAKAIAEEIDCVVGMSRAIGDSDAIHFAGGFYQGLAYGRNIETSFGLGKNEINRSGLPGGATPQLLMRSGVEAATIFFVGPNATKPPHTMIPPALPPIPGAPLIFISYAHANDLFVQQLVVDLQAQGVQVWIDKQGLNPGTTDWEQAIRDALQASSAVLLIASRDSRRSKSVNGELKIARMYERKIYPIWAEGDQWADCAPLELIMTQYIDARSARYKTALAQIVSALGAAASAASSQEAQIPRPAEPEPTTPPRNPYKGLRAFGGQDTGDFFGREKLVGDLLDMLRVTLAATSSPRFMAVIVGPSGSGKSSVVLAGLMPKLRAGALPNADKWVYLDPMSPRSHPLEQLTVALSRIIKDRSLESIRADLNSDSARGLHMLASGIAGQRGDHVVLVIDQFEELFTQTTDENERQHFINLLVNAVSEPQGPTMAIVTLRADFYDRPMKYSALGQLVEACNKSVLPMDLDDLRAVIEKPAALPDVRLTFDEGLVGDLLFEVRGEAAALPLLQFTLDQLFERREERRLTQAAYRQMGGVRGALAKHAEATYALLPSDEHRLLARVLFLRLIDPGTTERDTTRRPLSFQQLQMSDPDQTAMMRTVVDAFVDARLLIAETDSLEVSHEALIREWKRLSDWLRESRDDIIIQKQVSEDAIRWIAQGRDPHSDLLYRGTVLDDSFDWAKRAARNLDESDFLSAASAFATERNALEEKRKQELLETAQRAEQAAVRASAETERAERARIEAETADQRSRRTRQIALISIAGLLIISLLVGVSLTNTANNANATVTQAQADVATARVEATVLALRQGRNQTLVAGLGLVPPQENALSNPDFIATQTQIAALIQRQSVTKTVDTVPMLLVPAGCFYIGNANTDVANAVSSVCVDSFWIDTYEVTNGQFDRLKGETAAAALSDPGEDLPRTLVSWTEADAFCQHRGTRLPRENEWEYAARGPNSSLYPWGSTATPSPKTAPAPSGSDPINMSWIGVHDMSGNVWEWVSDLTSDGQHIYRGGSWDFSAYSGAARWLDADQPIPNVGFRCAASVEGDNSTPNTTS